MQLRRKRFDRPDEVRNVEKIRILAMAEPGQVLVSGTVRDLLAGSGLEFTPGSEFELRGIDGRTVLAAFVR